jgi:uncharacterized DUF497 family protein
MSFACDTAVAPVFEWDDLKADANLRKHDVSFEEAIGVFLDPLELTVPDADHSDDEDRWRSTGLGFSLRLLVVSYTQRGDTIRIVSARHATRQERKRYEESQR